MMEVKCPKCGIISTDKDFAEGTEKVGVYTNNDWKNVYECWECNHEWVESVKLRDE